MSSVDRRQALKVLGAASLAGLSPSQLFVVGRGTHASLQTAAGEGRHLFRSLDPDQDRLVTAVAELIIPETDTPGAKAARVNEFIDVMLADWFTPDERARFIRGLSALDNEVDDEDGRFVDTGEAEQIEILTRWEAEERASQAGSEPTPSPADQPFFAVMKWLTLWGYYTSQVGMEKELEHEAFPGSYLGCAPSRKG